MLIDKIFGLDEVYEDEHKWLSGEKMNCRKTFENYCQEVKERCTKFVIGKLLFRSCVEEIRREYNIMLAPKESVFKIN